MPKVTIALSLSQEVVAELDLRRKITSRSAYFEFILKKFLEKDANDG